MSKRLWDKGGASDAEMMRYTARDDWQLDQRLLRLHILDKFLNLSLSFFVFFF